MTTSYDLALEQALLDAGEEFDVVSYIASGRHRGRFCHLAPDGTAAPIEIPNTYATELSLERRTIILKLHGRFDPSPQREWESFVVTEDDYIEYLGQSDVSMSVPVGLAAKLQRSHFLFLGYTMADWNLRVVLKRLWGDHPLSYRSWAVQPDTKGLEREFWRRLDVDVLQAPLEEYVELLGRHSRWRCRHDEPTSTRARRARRRGALPESPYKGLAPFGDSDLDALLFFGRERDSEIVVANLLAARLTVLYGSSGVGKSSLLAASVARRLRAGARRRGDRLLVVVGRRGRAAPRRAGGGRARGRDAYLILDQFEEYFLYHADDEGEGTLAEELPELLRRTRPPRERADLRARGRARLARRVQGAHPERARELAAARAPRPGRRARRDHRAARALERAGRRGRGASRSSRRSSRRCSTRRPRGASSSAVSASASIARPERRQRAGGGADPPARHGAALAGRASGRARACSASRRCAASAAPRRSSATTSSARSGPCSGASRTSPRTSSTTSSRRPARRSPCAPPTSPSTPA